MEVVYRSAAVVVKERNSSIIAIHARTANHFFNLSTVPRVLLVMTRSFAFTIFVILLAALQAAPLPQAPATQGGGRGGAGGGAGRGATVPTRTLISGYTVPADAAEPLPGVTITFVKLDAPSGNLQTVSDANGRFTLNVSPGRYALIADRTGYRHSDRFQTASNAPVVSEVTVLDGQRLDTIIVSMVPVPPIAGIIYDVYGQRLAGVPVHAYRVRYSPYGRQLVLAATVLSHEGGEYRLFHLVPGYYAVAASYSDRAIQPWRSFLKLTPNLSSPDDGYSTVYFPSALRISDAKLVNLNVDADAGNTDIAFKESEYYKLTIKLIPPPPQGRAMLNQRVALLPLGADIGAAVDYRLKGAGLNFSVDRLALGDYVVVVVADLFDPDGMPYTTIVSNTVPIRVTENTEVTIPLQDPIDLPGRVTINTANNSALRTMQVRLVRTDRAAGQTITASVDNSGRFNLLDVAPGTYDVFLQGMPRGAYIQDVNLPGAQTALGQIRIDSSRPQRVPDETGTRWRSSAMMTVLLNLNGITAEGVVTDLSGKTAIATVALVPNDPVARLREDRYFVTSSDPNGAFLLQGVPAGNYTAYAFQRIEPEIYFDPDFNQKVRTRGTPVVVSNNGKANVNLTIITSDELEGIIQ